MGNKTRFTKKQAKQERTFERKLELAMMNPLFIELRKVEYCISMDIAKASVLGNVDTETKLRIQLELVRTLKQKYLNSIQVCFE